MVVSVVGGTSHDTATRVQHATREKVCTCHATGLALQSSAHAFGPSVYGLRSAVPGLSPP